jgi:hypothetical protein
MDKKCNCEDDDNHNYMNYLLLIGIMIIIGLIIRKKCI